MFSTGNGSITNFPFVPISFLVVAVLIRFLHDSVHHQASDYLLPLQPLEE